jgi:tRNA(Ile)-lysidine synthase
MHLGRPNPISFFRAEAQRLLAQHLDGDRQAPLAVAFSGGSDSLATLLLTLDFATKQGRKVLALTVDHGLQTASRGWAQHLSLIHISEPTRLM